MNGTRGHGAIHTGGRVSTGVTHGTTTAAVLGGVDTRGVSDVTGACAVVGCVCRTFRWVALLVRSGGRGLRLVKTVDHLVHCRLRDVRTPAGFPARCYKSFVKEHRS